MIRKDITNAGNEQSNGTLLRVQDTAQWFKENVQKHLFRGLGHITSLNLLVIRIDERSRLHGMSKVSRRWHG
jgi:hypothetical protein